MSAYLDHAAATPLRSEARDAWLAASAEYANASSVHRPGQRARRLLEDAREQLAEILGCDSVEVVFTSGGTEAINLAIQGLWAGRAPGTDAIVLPDGEHHATMDTVAALVQREAAVPRRVPLQPDGKVRRAEFGVALAGAERRGAEQTRAALATALVANNEIGTINPVADLSVAAASADIPLHLDAVAALGQLPLNYRELRGDAAAGVGLVAMSVSAHTVGGPVGVGALVVDRTCPIRPIVHGGGAQRGLRPGTPDVCAAAAFAAAARAATADRERDSVRLRSLRDRMVVEILARVPEARLLGSAVDRLPGNANLHFPGAVGESVLFLLDQHGIAVSTGSACQAGVTEPSHVAMALGLTAEQASQVIRVTLGHTSTDDEVDGLLAVIADTVQRARSARRARKLD